MTARYAQVPLKHVVTYNNEVLPESFDPDAEIDYVEISDVDSQRGITGRTSMKFSEAPSRARRRVRTNDVLVSTVRTYLRAIASAGESHDGVIASTGFCVLRPAKVHPRYLKYAALSPEFVDAVIARSTGISYPAINATDLVRLPIPMPSSDLQLLVADFLDRETAQIDDLIGKQERLIELLAEKRQAIITQAVTKGLDPTAPTKPSGIPWQGPVPEHWTVQPLKNLMRMQTGVTLGKDFSDVETETYAYLRVANVQIGYVDLKDVKEIDLPTEVAASSILQPGDVLMTEGGDRDKLARGCIWDGSISPCVHQNHIFAVRTGPQLLNSFLVLLLDADPARAYFYLTGKQSTNLASTNSTTVKNFRFGVPPISEQLRIVTHLKTKTLQIDDLVEKAKAVISTLKERRSALISAAVTGKIEVGSS